MQKGVFTISLDFELYWGVRDHRSLTDYGSNIRNVHSVIPRLLDLFEQYRVHCTWATVGFLFFKNKKELLQGLPQLCPDYLNSKYDPYSYIMESELEERCHFAPGLIERIRNTVGQEIGTHTFSHFYSLERNTTDEQFRADLLSAIGKAKKTGIEISSIVFPRNQYADTHLEICRDAGIRVYRGNEKSGIYSPVSREKENIFRRAARLADSYINLTGHHAYQLPLAREIVNIPSSRFLRPYSKRLKSLDTLKFKRIRNSIEYAARNGLIYHLWWHPHNFGDHAEENFSFLEKILKVYSRLNVDQKMVSQNLREIYIQTTKSHHEN